MLNTAEFKAMDNKVKQLEFIQGIVSRLAVNSFQLKGWSVFIVVAILGVGSLEGTSEIAILAVLPVLVFWGLDGYYLWQERLFRLLYDHIRRKNPAEVDFDMDPRPVKGEDKGWLSATFSRTVLLFHGVLLFAMLVVWGFINCHIAQT